MAKTPSARAFKRSGELTAVSAFFAATLALPFEDIEPIPRNRSCAWSDLSTPKPKKQAPSPVA
jgi:hypothetical protein